MLKVIFYKVIVFAIFLHWATLSEVYFAGNKAFAEIRDRGALENLVSSIEDPKQRAQLIQNLRLLLEATPHEKKLEVKSVPVTEIPPATDEIGGDLVDVFGKKSGRVFNALSEFGNAIISLGRLPDWIQRQMIDSKRRAFWIEVATGGIGLPLLVALIARWLIGLALSGTLRRLRDSVLETIRDRIFTGFVRAFLEAITVLTVLGSGYAALALVTRSPQSQEIAELLIQAVAIFTGIGVIARLVLSPKSAALRPVPIESATAAYIYIWVMRLATVGTLGFAISFMVSDKTNIPGLNAFEMLAGAVFAGLVLMMIMQSRVLVAAVIRGETPGPVRRRLSEIWHVLAIIYVLMGFGVFASGAQTGFLFLIQATSITAVTIIIGVFISDLFNRFLLKIFSIDPELNDRFPGLRERSNLYRPVLKRIVDIILIIAITLAILSGWEINVLEALSEEVRGQILKSAGTILFVVILSVLAWEFASGLIARSLAETNADGSPRKMGSRARTLLPLLRRSILIALIIFSGLIILAEIGIDIAPLLAGAGVLGLAIGFGSQALVRDIITGLFILIEDTIAVGDVVTVGGHTGIVEDLSIRTIRLRDVSGTVHTVPFGDVTTVENFTKDYSYALLDIGVAYREDTDVVSDALKDVAKDLMADEYWADKILEPIQVMGVQELADSAVIIRSRIKTQPIMQWAVRREFYRRVKKQFDYQGIEMPFPHTTLYFGEDQDGQAPAARVLIEGNSIGSKSKSEKN